MRAWRRALPAAAALAALLIASAVVWATEPRYRLDDGGGGAVTVLDDATGLEWEQKSSTTDKMTWEAALTLCEERNYGGHSDWRLPNVNELPTIVDDRRSAPPINTTYFVDFAPARYWTSTTNPKSSGTAYIVDFDTTGAVDYEPKSNTQRVLCVRTQ